MPPSHDTLNSVADLLAAGLIPQGEREAAEQVAARYAVAITPAMAQLIDPTDPDDPISRQFLPDARELETRPEELADPIGDHARSPVVGIVHRYTDRVLLKLASVCPVYCRFCFRREMVGPVLGEALSQDELRRALDYIRTHPEVWEVVVTGGDPLILSPRRIATVGEALAEIGHVKVVRWHTRVPVVAPERVTGELIGALKRSAKAVWIGLHANHVREFTPRARQACRDILDAGLPIVSQTVLLRGVNDDADTLDALMRAFVETGIKPYYLHHADLAPGTSHFRTSIADGQALIRLLRRRLSGLAMPTYVLDVPGGSGKVPAGPGYVTPVPGGASVEDGSGTVRHYLDSCPS